MSLKPDPIKPISQLLAVQDTSSLVSEVTDETFDAEVLKSTLPVLVDFWSPRCGHCKMANPRVELLANDFNGKLKVVKLNVDENEKTTSDYGISSIPTFILFKAGQKLDQTHGLQTKKALSSFLLRWLLR